jgi:antitoxin VapB
VLRFLERKVWPTLPKAQVGRRLSRAEEDEILGYGPEGV